MALIVLIILGAALGWFASIVTRTESAGEIMQQIGLSLIAALIAGLIVNSGTVMGGLSLMALGAASAASILVMVLYHTVLRRREA
ncbi:MAG: hypothetical protein AAGK01_13200 [Pseudomonadota bacterium]